MHKNEIPWPSWPTVYNSLSLPSDNNCSYFLVYYLIFNVKGYASGIIYFNR